MAERGDAFKGGKPESGKPSGKGEKVDAMSLAVCVFCGCQFFGEACPRTESYPAGHAGDPKYYKCVCGNSVAFATECECCKREALRSGKPKTCSACKQEYSEVLRNCPACGETVYRVVAMLDEDSEGKKWEPFVAVLKHVGQQQPIKVAGKVLVLDPLNSGETKFLSLDPLNSGGGSRVLIIDPRNPENSKVLSLDQFGVSNEMIVIIQPLDLSEPIEISSSGRKIGLPHSEKKRKIIFVLTEADGIPIHDRTEGLELPARRQSRPERKMTDSIPGEPLWESVRRELKGK